MARSPLVTVVVYRGGQPVRLRMRRSRAREMGLEIIEDKPVRTKIRKPRVAGDVRTKGS